MITSTLGQILVNDALPEEYRDYTRTLGKDEADAVLGDVARKYPERYKDVSWRFMQLGREHAYLDGTTLRLSDLIPVMDKEPLLKHVAQQEARIKADKTMTPEEKEQTLSGVYSQVHKHIVDTSYQAALAKNNPFAMQVKSKARGSPLQLTQILTTPGVYQDAQDRTVPLFIRHSYSEGLSPAEYWASTFGARKGVISSKFATRQGGALGKQFSVALADLRVTAEDCGTPHGLPVPADDMDNLGSVLARDAGKYPAGTVINKEILSDLKRGKVDDIVVRSPATCGLSDGICKYCTGLRENGKFPEIGHHIGINAGSALAERVAQQALNVKHTGQKTKGSDEYSGFDVVESLANVPKTFPHVAAVSTVDGRVDKIEEAPQGGTYIYIDGTQHYASAGMDISVKEGDTVEQGDRLSGGIVNPAEVAQFKGVGEGRRYFIERMTKAFRDSKYDVNRRNVEVLGRALVNHVEITDMDNAGDNLPGDIVPYTSVAQSYKPRKDASYGPLSKAVGSYLEEPVLHYTIGTRITKNTAKQLKKYGIDSVLSHPVQPGFTSKMVSMVKVPQYADDWMARLGSTYLESRLLNDVQHGQTSITHGGHPLPEIARGVDLGVK